MSGIITVIKAAIIGAVGKLTMVIRRSYQIYFSRLSVNRQNKTKFRNIVLLSERKADPTSE